MPFGAYCSPLSAVLFGKPPRERKRRTSSLNALKNKQDDVIKKLNTTCESQLD